MKLCSHSDAPEVHETESTCGTIGMGEVCHLVSFSSDPRAHQPRPLSEASLRPFRERFKLPCLGEGAVECNELDHFGINPI